MVVITRQSLTAVTNRLTAPITSVMHTLWMTALTSRRALYLSNAKILEGSMALMRPASMDQPHGADAEDCPDLVDKARGSAQAAAALGGRARENFSSAE